jgi:maleylpyruvate isomerase
VAADPLDLIDEVHRATDRLLSTVGTLDDDAVAGPSGLPGWTRGHVLTHLARNADGLVNLLTWARTGVETPQYPSLEHRAADIEAGAPRPRHEQLADLQAASARFAAAADDMPPQAWTATVTWRSGHTNSAVNVVWARLSEVEIHHVDLDAGYRPADWPLSFVLRSLRQTVERFGRDADRPPVVIRAPEVGHDLAVSPDPGAAVVTGPAYAALAWLLGRSTGTGLTIDPPGPLPPVPSFG